MFVCSFHVNAFVYKMVKLVFLFVFLFLWATDTKYMGCPLPWNLEHIERFHFRAFKSFR